MGALNLKTGHIAGPDGNPTDFGRALLGYFSLRAQLLNGFAHGHLLTAEEAKRLFCKCVRDYVPDPLSIPWNKQKGKKKAPAYLTAIVSMILSQTLGESSCDFDPLSLTSVTVNGEPFRTLARRVDGAYPSILNPTAVWEIKEYYYTTTFGSRVADGIYETLLDGLELEGLEQSAHGKIFHYLIVDARDTWWGQGNPYLCRIIDMLHMGYIDEAIFGSEVVDALPNAAAEWRAHEQALQEAKGPTPETAVRVPPVPKHLRLSPTDRRNRAEKWNAWATANGLDNLLAVPTETAEQRQSRLERSAEKRK